MRLLQRYLLRETFYLYLLGVLAFCLLLSIDMLTLWARFLISYSATPAQIGQLMLYRLPWFLHLSLPVAVIFGVFLATGRLAKDSELKAGYALGVPPLAMLAPLLAFGLAVFGASVLNNGWLEPLTRVRYDQLVNSFVYDRPPPEVQSDVAYRVPDAGVFYAGRVRATLGDGDRAQLSGVLIIRDDGSTITAAEGEWSSSLEGSSWTLYDAEVTPAGAAPESAPVLTLPFAAPLQAADSLSASDQLTLHELWHRRRLALAGGAEVRGLTYELHRRLADAFSAAVFALLAGVMGLGLHGRGAGFGWTIALIAVFWVLWTLSGNFFERGVLSAPAAAWFTSAAVGALGLGLAWWRLR